jgi:GT2 family glycosyltransferase
MIREIEKIMDFPKVAIIILVWNDYENTKKCIISLSKINYTNIQIIVVDNKSSDNCCNQLQKEFQEIEYIFNDQNYGYAGGNNIGIEFAIRTGADYVFVMNNDTIIDSPDIISSMLSCFSWDKNLGILGPRLLQLDLDGNFSEVKYKSRYYQFIGKKLLLTINTDTDANNSLFDVRTVVSGCALMIKSDVIEILGGFNYDFFMFVEENDFCIRAIKAGFKIGQATSNKTIVRHTGGVSYNKSAAWKSFLLNRNKFLELRSFNMVDQLRLVFLHLIGLSIRMLKFVLICDFNHAISSLIGTLYGFRIWIRDIFKLSVSGEYFHQARKIASGNHILRKLF